jgi:hypothetical protein
MVNVLAGFSECCEEQALEKIQPFSENDATIFSLWGKVNGFSVSAFQRAKYPGRVRTISSGWPTSIFISCHLPLRARSPAG